MLAVAALMTGVTSCNNDDLVDNGTPDGGKPTYLELNVSFANPGTYATADDNATVTESEVKTVSVFIFSNQQLVSKSSLTGADFTQSSNGQKDVYTASRKVATTTGVKSIYVGVNLPASFDLELGATLAQLKEGVVTASVVDITNATTGFSMFSSEEKTVTLVETTDPAYASTNKITAPVERLSTKVAVRAAAGLSLTTGGGTLSDLQFAIRQSNTKMFRYKYVDGINVKDPNWDTYAATDFENFSDYVAINASTITDNKLLAVKYAAENTSKLHLEKETTYASIKATFVPGNFTDATGALVPYTGTAKTFWMVSINGGVKNYFDAEATADAYMALPAIAAQSPVKSAAYTDGTCYYNLWLNPAGGYNAVRNSFYKATIMEVVAPGNPSPEPVEPEESIDKPTDILVEFEILPWNLVSWDAVLR